MNTIDQILECEDRAYDLWVNRTKFSVKHEDRLRSKIHKIHEIEDLLFKQVWEEMDNNDKDDFEVFERRDFAGHLRYVWCDATIHLETTKKGTFKFGILCNC